MSAPGESNFETKRSPALAALLEQGPLAACLKDAENQFRYVYVSPEWARVLGHDPAECLGKDDYELSPPPVAGQLRHIDEAALQGGRHEGILIDVRRENGERMWYSVAWPVEAEAGRHYVACCSVEIGPRALAEREAAALHEYARGAGLAAERALVEFERKRARLMRLVESGMVGIIVGAGDTIVDANQAFLDMLGYTQEDVAQERLHFSRISAPEYAEADRQTLAELAASGVSIPKEKEYIAKDGRRVSVYGAGALLDAVPTREPHALR